MTILLSWTDLHGRYHSCSDACHYATSPPTDCHCICRGIYHGTALANTLRRTRDARGHHVIRAAKQWARRTHAKLTIHHAAYPTD